MKHKFKPPLTEQRTVSVGADAQCKPPFCFELRWRGHTLALCEACAAVLPILNVARAILNPHVYAYEVTQDLIAKAKGRKP